MGNPSSVRKRRFIAGGSVRFVLRRDDDEPNDEQDHQKRHKQDHSNRDHFNRHLIASFRVVNGLLRGSSGRWEREQRTSLLLALHESTLYSFAFSYAVAHQRTLNRAGS